MPLLLRDDAAKKMARDIAMIRFILTCCWLLGATGLRADAQPLSDDSSPISLRAFIQTLHDYREALARGDRAYLALHTDFPLPYVEADLDMEARPIPHRLANVEDVLRVRETLSWPQALVPATVGALVALKSGAEKCSDPDHPDVPDWSAGKAAFVRRSDLATLSYLEAPCEAATHVVTLTFVQRDTTWRLRRRDIRIRAP